MAGQPLVESADIERVFREEHARLSALRPPDEGGTTVEDDRLRLIFTCCHPALAPTMGVPSRLAESRCSRPS